MISLDIFSDPICPWCYIGKAHLDVALAQHPDHPFDLRWRPFQLNPDMPRDGMDRRTYLETKFGGQEGAARAYLPVQQHADAAGLPINLAGIARTPNTRDAHRLIHWAGIEGVQTTVVAALFTAYFVENRDISDHDVLADVADSASLDASVILKLLGSDADERDIVEQDAAARGMGITSVPTFVVAGQHAVPGAQPPELWSKVISELAGQPVT